MKNLLFAFAVFLGILLSFHLVAADECGQTPTDHCTISTSTTFTPGNYQVENITIIANNTLVDCNGAIFTHVDGWLFNVRGTTGVTIQNCEAYSYMHAVTNDLGSPSTRQPVETLTVRDNTFENIALPIRIDNSLILGYSQSPAYPNNQIINNTITNSATGGMYFIKSDNNYIADNSIDGTSGPNYDGILIHASANTVVERNTLHTAKLNLARFGSWNSTNVTIFENNITDVYRAIHLEAGSDRAIIENNNLENVVLGIYVRSDAHTIRHNTLMGEESLFDSNSAGVFIEMDTVPHKDSLISLNIFENMSDPAYDAGENNNWSEDVEEGAGVTMFGNFYENYHQDTQSVGNNQCTDINFDNICDDPYPFNVIEEDDYPLRSRSLTDFGGSSTINAPQVQPLQDIYSNEVDQIHVVITATSPVNAPLTYSIKNQQGQVDPRFVPVVGFPNEFIWNTGLFDAGNYTFLAVATDNQDLNHGVPFTVYLNESDSDCSLYLPNVIDGCEVRSNLILPAGTHIVPHGISITANNVVLDCNGATLDSANSDFTGITVINRQNVEINNCIVQQNTRGLLIQQSNDVRVHDSTFSESIGDAVNLVNSQNIQIQDNILTLSEYAVRFSNVQNSLLYRNQMLSNENGQIDLIGSSYNNITENNMDGIQFNRAVRLTSTSSNNVLYRNNFKNYISNSVDDGTNNQWTVNGEGNYWDDWSSQLSGPRACINNNWDTHCENPYQIRFVSQDTAPFSIANGWERPYPQITVSTTTPQQGQPMTITLVDPDMAGQLYFVVGDIFTGNGLPMGDGRIIDLAGSGVFFAMVQNPYNLGFSFSGAFDQNGVATITWNIPQIPGLSLSGVPVYFNILPFNPNLAYPQTILRTYRSPGVVIQ